MSQKIALGENKGLKPTHLYTEADSVLSHARQLEIDPRISTPNLSFEFQDHNQVLQAIQRAGILSTDTPPLFEPTLVSSFGHTPAMGDQEIRALSHYPCHMKDPLYPFGGGGVLNFLATQGGQKSWENPVTSQMVTVTSSGWSSDGSCGEHCVNDKGEHCNYTEEMPYAWVQLDLSLQYRLRCDGYALRSDAHSGQKLRTWEFHASIDGDRWETLRKHVDDKSLETKRFSQKYWSVSASKSYRYFRIVQTGPNSSNRESIMLHGVELFGTLEVLDVAHAGYNRYFEMTA